MSAFAVEFPEECRQTLRNTPHTLNIAIYPETDSIKTDGSDEARRLDDGGALQSVRFIDCDDFDG